MHNTNIPCGCLIEYEGDHHHQDYSINWCPLHDAAPDLLEALKARNAYRHGLKNPFGHDCFFCGGCITRMHTMEENAFAKATGA